MLITITKQVQFGGFTVALIEAVEIDDDFFEGLSDDHRSIVVENMSKGNTQLWTAYAGYCLQRDYGFKPGDYTLNQGD